MSVPLTALALAACTVGPNYRGAPDVASDSIKSATFVRTPAQGVAFAQHTPATWWTALNDPQLNALIDAALAGNPDLKMVQARLRQARSQLHGQQANKLPKVSGSAAAVRMRSPDTSFFSNGDQSAGGGAGNGSTGRGPVDFYTAGFDASWKLDLFGGTRRDRSCVRRS